MIEYDYTIAEHWLSPLINDDCSNLSDEEMKKLDNFIKSLPKHYLFKSQLHITWDIKEEEPFFAEDDISGLHANCFNVKLIYI